MDTPRRALIAIALLTAVVSASAGYYFGFTRLRHAEQLFAAGQDLLAPLSEVRERRLRRDAIRSLAESFRDYQTDYFREHEEFAEVADVPVPLRGITVNGFQRLQARFDGETYRTHLGWVGEFVYFENLFDVDRCAVALHQDDAYVAGIRLKASGRVRCSWDLATRLNR